MLFKKEFAKAARSQLTMQDDTDLLRTPAQKIVALLREIQNQYLASDSGDASGMIDRINYAIDKIGQRTIFEIDYPLLDSLDLALQRRPSMTTGWLNEFSNLGLEMIKETYLKASAGNRERKQSVSYSDKKSQLSRAPSLNTVLDVIEANASMLEDTSNLDFNTLKVCKDVGRKNGLSVITFHIASKLGLADNSIPLNRQKLQRFLGKIYNGYRRDVEYHNDMHAADVL